MKGRGLFLGGPIWVWLRFYLPPKKGHSELCSQIRGVVTLIEIYTLLIIENVLFSFSFLLVFFLFSLFKTRKALRDTSLNFAVSTHKLLRDAKRLSPFEMRSQKEGTKKNLDEGKN